MACSFTSGAKPLMWNALTFPIIGTYRQYLASFHSGDHGDDRTGHIIQTYQCPDFESDNCFYKNISAYVRISVAISGLAMREALEVERISAMKKECNIFLFA